MSVQGQIFRINKNVLDCLPPCLLRNLLSPSELDIDRDNEGRPKIDDNVVGHKNFSIVESVLTQKYLQVCVPCTSRLARYDRTVPYGPVQYGTVQYRKYGRVGYGVVWYGTARYGVFELQISFSFFQPSMSTAIRYVHASQPYCAIFPSTTSS